VPATGNTSYFSAAGYAVDSNKHALTPFDPMDGVWLRALCDYLSITYDQGADPDTKQTLVRAIETSLSAKYIHALTVTSAAGATSGKSAITIAGAIGGTGKTFAYKTDPATAPAAVLHDILPTTGWTAITSGAEITATYATGLDAFPDVVLAVYVLCQDMYDTRAYYVDKSNVNRVVDAILGMHCLNLL
jgi:hypothetical protein